MKKAARQFITKKQAWICLSLAVAVILIALGTNVALAEWGEPDLPPVVEQFYAPLTTGGENQAKKGYLLLDPEYDPTEATSIPFDRNKPLDVRGVGALFSTPYVYSDTLTVDTDTLYVDSVNDWVGIGTETTDYTDGVKLKVVGGTVQVGTSTNPISGKAISGYSSDSVGIYGDAGATGIAGVYGLRMADSGWAVQGVVDGVSNNQVGVRGDSADGYGIYAKSNATDQPAVYARNYSSGWAGYFDGRLGAGSDVVADMFLPSHLQQSLVSFTSGQKIGEYPASAAGVDGVGFFTPNMVFDGSNIWVTNKWDDIDGNEMFKIRASDGEIIGTYQLPGTEFTDITFDGRYLWLSGWFSEVTKVDPQDGSELAQCDTDSGGAGRWGVTPRDITTSVDDEGDVFLWTVNPDGGDVTKIDSDCNQIGIYPVGTNGSGDHENRLNEAGWRVRPKDIIFADGYIWTLLPNVLEDVGDVPYTGSICVAGETCQQNSDNLIKIDPDTGAVVGRYTTGLSAPGRLVFDGVHVWVISSSVGIEGKVAKFRVDDSQFIPLSLGSTPWAADLVFDGTYIWLAGVGGGTGSLFRITAHNGEIKEYPNHLWADWHGARLLFDGTYVWHLSTCNSTGCDGTNPLNLQKFYSGSGMGHTDLNSVVNLDPNSVQDGNINISGAAEVGSDLIVGADLDVLGNQWAGSDETVAVSGTANCSEGSFIKGVTLDGNSEIIGIICRGL